MTDTATAGAAAAGTSVDASATAATPGSTAAPASDPFAGLQNAESREWVKSKGYKDLDTIASDARFADKLKTEVADLKSKALTPPAPDAKPEEWNAFYAKLGRPEKAEGYEFKLPDGLPPEMPYDAEFAKTYKQWAFEEGLSPKQAQGQHDRFVKLQADAFKAQSEETAKFIAAKDLEMQKVLGGDKSSQTYKDSISLANRWMMNNGGEPLIAELRAAGLMLGSGENTVLTSPLLAKAMAVGGKAYKEDTTTVGSQVPARRSAAETLFPPEKDVFAKR